MSEQKDDDWDIPSDGRQHLPEEIERAIVGPVEKDEDSGSYCAEIDINQLPLKDQEAIIGGIVSGLQGSNSPDSGATEWRKMPWIRRHMLLRAFQGKKPRWYARFVWFFITRKKLAISLFVIAICVLAAFLYCRYF